MKITIADRVRFKIEEWKYNADIRRYKRKYPDYKDDEYNCGSLKHIWGVKSWDDLTGKDACLYTMNDIDITYDRDSDEYILGVETAYLFENKQGETEYLKRLLGAFTGFMESNNYKTDESYFFFMHNPETVTRAKTIDELYINFKIFVEGYCAVYGKVI